VTLQLKSKGRQVPDVEEASGQALSSGFVYVTAKTSTDCDVEPDKQVVLATASGYRELITTSKYNSTPGDPERTLAPRTTKR
jgi:hypothetical protein